MALRLGKRKRPPREEKQLREATNIASKVFDEKTLLNLAALENTKVFKSLDFPISTGKEAVVFRATRLEKGRTRHVAVKVYKYETTSFRNMLSYLEGDSRFPKIDKRLRPLVQLWARREFTNLRTARAAGALVPSPIRLKKNIVVMQFLGEKGSPCPLIKDVRLEKPGDWLELALQNLEKLVKSGIVHSDLSEFNIVACKGQPYFIDLSQGIPTTHARARELLERDVRNLIAFFRKAGAPMDFETAWSRVSANL